MEVKLDTEQLAQAKLDPNSGRTFDALHEAIMRLKDCPAVAFVVASETEIRRLHADIRLICEHHGLFVERDRSGRVYQIDGKKLLLRNANWPSAMRGLRAHFVLDHSVKEFLHEETFGVLLAAIKPAHEGPWPPLGA